MPEKFIESVAWRDGRCCLLDQRLLPGTERYLECHTSADVRTAIATLAVRGAPAIGIAGAYGVVLAAIEVQALPPDQQAGEFADRVRALEEARPTAVNLVWAISRLLALGTRSAEMLLIEAQRIHAADREANSAMARFGADLFATRGVFLTHCNTGDLATGGGGTAFGVVRELSHRGLVEQVLACEARPVLQGLRLTSYELAANHIPFRMICDSAVGWAMRCHRIQAVFVGADRVCANGDSANKIGTYQIAVLARRHRIPFYVVAPTSTFDWQLASGEQITIEERNEQEVWAALGDNQPSRRLPAWNPAFDVTPADLISGIICEQGVFDPAELPKPRNLDTFR